MEQERGTAMFASLKRILPCVQPGGPGATARLGGRTVRGLGLLLLALAVIGVSATGIVALRRGTPQVVLITFQDPQGHWVNQSARVDPEENVVTYSIKSLANHSAVVLFDGKNELVCYQPRGNICLVRQMTTNELENIQTFLTTMEHRICPITHAIGQFSQLLLWRNETQFSKEFLGILSGRVVDSLSVGKHINSLCDKSRIYWVQKRNGPGRQRLIYFCIDICFPNNICVSVCFYYLPD
ncbi:BRICHOS domain-containing protein 5 [Callorhinchus milii]|uniref:BRICHOS domain-containing protein 5 n=1 Tax=Callorhinchus milii TaxID=7868 RepID=UPI001C3FB7DE|nr:BRICHOS domain-containing protein 5 [Callorhinchus milii]